MQTIIAIIGVVALAVIIGLATFMVLRRRRSGELRARFGPEYDLALQGHGDRRAAENALSERERKARGLELRELTDAERVDFTQSWDAVQLRFVDDPVGAASQAHALLEEVMRQRGYPTVSFEEEVELLSVHHPASVQHYRAAHALVVGSNGNGADGNGNGNGNGSVSTEENRQALIHYRALFEDMLESDEAREALDATQTQETPVTRELREREAREATAESPEGRDTRRGDGGHNEARQ
jgi:hypothetical protein